jgi:PRC-barrel domain
MASEEKVTGKLIGSDKVEGTAVYGPDGERIGSIERIMIDKLSGKASYVVLGFGGFAGTVNLPVIVEEPRSVCARESYETHL